MAAAQAGEFPPDGADDTGTGILHVDMDAFYASVEILDDPSLRGKPIIVGAPEGRSVVSSASYEARRFGVRSAMPVAQALRLCPTATVVLPHFDRYLEESAKVMAVFREAAFARKGRVRRSAANAAWCAASGSVRVSRWSKTSR